MSRAIILLQFQYCTYLVCFVIYVLLLSYDYFDETLRRNVPKYHCLYIYIYIFKYTPGGHTSEASKQHRKRSHFLARAN